ncbi:MAG: DUF11 domain-containing protein, partial [Anaerolineae bacterium]|nr:DUF11 domain-containing protein [Anaerolineae bacterium]
MGKRRAARSVMLVRWASCLVVIVSGLGFSFSPVATAGAQENATGVSQPGLELIRSDAHAIVLRLVASPLQVTHVDYEGHVYDVIDVDGYASRDVAGSPQVPAVHTLLALPQGADLEIAVSSSGCSVLDGSFSLPPAPTAVRPQPDPHPDAVTLQPPGQEELLHVYVQDPAVYAANTYYPAHSYALDSIAYLRNQRVAGLWLYPFQYNPISGEIRMCEELTVDVRFSYSAAPTVEDLGIVEPAGPFEQILEEAVLNYESARGWRGNENKTLAPRKLENQEGDLFKLLVEQAGIYKVTRAELVSAGVPVDSIDLDTLKLFYRQDQVPIEVHQAAGALDYFLFYGESIGSKYTRTNVYWLTYGGEDGQRMVPRDAPPSLLPVALYAPKTVHLEEDHRYLTATPWADTDHWYWAYTRYPSPTPFLDFGFTLTSIYTSAYSAAVELNMHGYNDMPETPDHCIQVYVNGQSVLPQDLIWDGRVEQQPCVAIPSMLLLEGANTVRVQGCPSASTYDMVAHNWVHIDYRDLYFAENDQYTFRAFEAGVQYEIDGFQGNDITLFDVTTTVSTTRLVDFTTIPSSNGFMVHFSDPAHDIGSEYVALRPGAFKTVAGIVADAPSNLADSGNQADYIMIAPATLLAETELLAAYRSGQGHNSTVVDLQDVMDEFNYGVFSPLAIRDFVDHAYHNWAPPAPMYLLLVGDGHYDFLNNLGTTDLQLMPPYLGWVDPWLGEAPADNRYVTVAGDDVFPDLMVGRLPASSTSSLQAMVSKIVAYESAPPTDDWNQQVLFVTDNYPDNAGNFYALSDSLIDNFLPSPYAAQRVYLGNTCSYENPSVACKQQILNTLNGTSALIVNYIGHAGNQQWAAERLLRVQDVGVLTPNDRFPIMLPMTCLEGYFAYPALPSLAESVVRATDKGAVASWSPAGYGVVHGHEELNKGFFEAVFFDGVRQLGAATYLGKLRLYMSGANLDQIDTYHLFGDPALHINALDADVSISKTVSVPANPMPGDQLLYTLAFANAGPATAHGVLLTDLIPAGLVNPTVVYQTANVVGTLPGADYTWQIADLAPGETGEIRVQATIDPMREPPFSLVNNASISMNEPDLDPANDASTVTTAVTARRPTDLQIAKAVQAPAEPQPGDTFTYTLAFTNAGPGAAHGIVITDLIPTLLLDPVVVYTSPEVVGLRPG